MKILISALLPSLTSPLPEKFAKEKNFTCGLPVEIVLAPKNYAYS